MLVKQCASVLTIIVTVEQRTRDNLQYAWMKVLLHSNYFNTQHKLVQDT